MATRAHLSEAELRLVREIEAVRLETERVRAETERVRAEIEQVRAELKKEIEQVRGETRVLVEKTRANLLQWMFVFWASQFAAIAALLWRLWGTT